MLFKGSYEDKPGEFGLQQIRQNPEKIRVPVEKIVGQGLNPEMPVSTKNCS